jgi:hypothetical protein
VVQWRGRRLQLWLTSVITDAPEVMRASLLEELERLGFPPPRVLESQEQLVDTLVDAAESDYSHLLTSSVRSPLREALFGRAPACVVVPAVKHVSHAVDSDDFALPLESAVIPPGSVVLSGSFNPLHSGHERLLRAGALTAQQELARIVAHESLLEAGAVTAQLEDAQASDTDDEESIFSRFPGWIVTEITVSNPDKGHIDEKEALLRIEQLVGPLHAKEWQSVVSDSESLRSRYPSSLTGASGATWPVLLTKAPLFVDKADFARDSWFIVGLDTVTRLCNPKYYGNDETAVVHSLAQFQAKGCRFLVAGRPSDAKTGTGDFKRLDGA